MAGWASDGSNVSVPVAVDPATGRVLVNATGGSSGGTSSTFGATFPATGTAVGAISSTGTMAGLNLDASGNLKVLVGNASIAVTGTFWQTTQPVSLTSTTITGSVAVTGTFFQTTQPVSLTSTTITGTVAVTESGTWNVGLLPATSGGLSMATGSITATATAIKSSAGQVYGWYFYNSNATVAYVTFYNTVTGSTTIGTNIILALGIPATSGANVTMPIGLAFSTAITIAVTTTRTGNTSPGSSVDYNIFYD